MGPSQLVPEVQVEGIVFPPAVKPPGSCNKLFLGGAGARGLEIQGKFVKFTAIGVYLAEEAVPFLAVKWKGKTAQELTDSVDFFRDVVTGPFEKFMRVTMILPLSGQQYSEKVTENCVAYWKAVGSFTDAEATAVHKFLQVFKDENFPPGSSILFTLSPSGSLTIGFSKDGSVPEQDSAVIENKQLSEAILESMIGKHGVSPEAKQCLAARVSQLLQVEVDEMGPTQLVSEVKVEGIVFPPAAKPPGSCNKLFLGGAGARGLEMQGKFVKFTAIGVYLAEEAVPFLAVKWKGKTAQELTDSVDFFKDVVTGPFEKFMRVTMILPLSGQQYSEKVTENCVAFWKAVGSFTDAEASAVDKFLQVFKDENFPPGSSILFTLSPSGSLTIGFSKDSSLPEQGSAVIENKQLCEAILESMIGKHGVSPEAKQCLAGRVSQLLQVEVDRQKTEKLVAAVEGEKLKQ